MTKVTLSALGILTITTSACSSEARPTYPFAATHTAIVSGRVIASDGTPIDSAVISVAIRPRALYGYANNPAASNVRGEFVYTVERMTAPPTVPTPDTVRVEVTAQLLRIRDRNPDGSTPILRDTLVVTFAPAGQAPQAVQKEFRFSR